MQAPNSGGKAVRYRIENVVLSYLSIKHNDFKTQTRKDMTKTKTLVNFRTDTIGLDAFDDACRLSGYTRTLVLNQLMRDFTTKAAGSIPKQIAEERRLYKTLRAAVERAEQRKRALEPKTARSTFRHRPRKGFAEFIADDPIVGKRR